VLAVRGEFAGVEDHVVAFAVAVGAGDTETAAGGLQDELEFGELSETLGVEFALAGGGRLWAVWTGTLRTARRVEQRFRAGVQFEWLRLLPAGLCRDRLFRDKLFRDKLWARR
jgi:hypothetical protein